MANRSLRPAGSSGLARQRAQDPLDQFHREVDTLFNRVFGGAMAPFEEDWGMTRGWGFDVEEKDKEMIVRAEMPGFDEKEMDVRLENGVLTIQAEKEQTGDGQRNYRRFFRQMSLPPGIDAEKIHASYRNGVLELRMPRPEGSQAKRIPVHGQPAETGGDGAGQQAGKKEKK